MRMIIGSLNSVVQYALSANLDAPEFPYKVDPVVVTEMLKELRPDSNNDDLD